MFISTETRQFFVSTLEQEKSGEQFIQADKACITERHIRERKDNSYHYLLLINQHFHFHLVKFNSSSLLLLALQLHVQKCWSVSQCQKWLETYFIKKKIPNQNNSNKKITRLLLVYISNFAHKIAALLGKLFDSAKLTNIILAKIFLLVLFQNSRNASQ